MPSSSRASPPEVVFFTDRDLGTKIPERLRDAGALVEAHDDHFGPTTTDVEWLQAVSRRGWVVLSKNRRIRYTPLEIAALMESGVACFMLIGKRPHAELAENLVEALPKVYQFLASHEAPYIAKIYNLRAWRCGWRTPIGFSDSTRSLGKRTRLAYCRHDPGRTAATARPGRIPRHGAGV